MPSSTDTTDSTSTDNTPVLPIRSVDPDADLADRLTENTRNNIGPSRYFQSEDGEVYEDWGDVFARVAKNVALAEAVFHKMPLHVSPDVLAGWVDIQTAQELFDADDDDVRPMRKLDEELAPYCDYDRVRERAPDEIAEAMDGARERFEQAMREQRWMPNTPTLINAGTELQQLSACFVRNPRDALTDEIEDERRSIMGTAKEAATILKTGGGIGYAFHLLRPKGARIASTDGVSSGPVSFMDIYDSVCGTIAQGGVRRGAMMAIMHAQHPDIGRFCVAKRGEDRFTNFNISVGITDEFLDAVENDAEYTLVDPTTGWPGPDPFEVVPETAHFYDPQFADAWNDQMDKPAEGYDGKVVTENFWRDYLDDMGDPEAFEEFRDRIDLEPGEPMTLPARFIWQLLIDGAHNNGEPGFVNLDEINREHSFDVKAQPSRIIHATNPCSEQPLQNGEPCNLGHVNLSLMVEEGAPSYHEWVADEHDGAVDATDLGAGAYLDQALNTEQLRETVETGTYFLDNVVTMSKFPLDVIEEMAHSQRKIGLGIMGFHHLLLQLGVEYGSEESYEIAREVMRRVDEYATHTSHYLALSRGVFPEWENSKWANVVDNIEWIRKHGHIEPYEFVDGGFPMRNHNVTTVAPTGTTSMISDTTGGCEPLYNVAYFKNVSDDVQGEGMLVEVDDYFQRTLAANDIDVDEVLAELETKMLANEFDSVEDLETVPDDIGDLFVTAENLNVEQHIHVQAAFQDYCDSSISKTLNISNDATHEDVSDAIWMALTAGIKGSTVYRVGSRSAEVKTTSTTGGGVPLVEASDRALVDELRARVDDNETLRTDIMSELGVVDTTVETVECPDMAAADTGGDGE